MNPRDTEELAALWTSAQRTVAAFIATLIPDFHEAEDVLQAVAVRKYPEYDRGRPLLPWAIGIARNEVLGHRRRQATSKIRFSDELMHRIADGYQRLSADLGPVREALRECLQEVEGRSRQALELRYAEGLKPARVAEQMSLSVGAARMLLTRVRAAIRDCVQRRLGALGGAV